MRDPRLTPSPPLPSFLARRAGLLAEIDAHRGEDDLSPETALPPVKVGRGKKAPRSSAALARIFKKAVHKVIEKRRGRVLRLRQVVMLTKADHDRQLEADKKRAKAFAKALEADAAKLGDAALDGIKRSADLAVAWQKKLKQAAFGALGFFFPAVVLSNL